MDLLDLQYGILGHMIVYPEHVGDVMTRLTVEDFDSLPTRGLFEAVSRLYLAGAPIDKVTVLQEAGADYEAAVKEALAHTASDGAYYCSLLREGMQLQKIQGCAYDLASAATMADAGKVIDRLNGLATLRQKAEVVTAHEAAADFIRRMGGRRKPEYLSLGMRDLDELLYLELGDFVLLGGLASAGKTMLSLQFAQALAEKYRVGYFTLETNCKKLTDRLIAHMAQVPLSAIKDCILEGEDARQAWEAARRLDKLDIGFVHSSGMAVQDIQTITLSRRYQVIFVDYLQIADAPGKSRYEQVTNISIGLHTLAQAHGVAVFALAQLSRPEKNRKDGTLLPPSLSSFRESGQLEQDADVAMLLWPSELNNNNSSRVLKIAKNKEGQRDSLNLSFNGVTQTFTLIPKPGTGAAAQFAAAGRRAKARRGTPEQIGFQDIPNDSAPDPFDHEKGRT